VVADFLARASACSLPIIPAWDFAYFEEVDERW